MVGFIGALSSALCILILVFITLIVGYIDSLLPEASFFRVNEATYRYPISSYYVTDDVLKELDAILININEDEKFKINSINVGCSFGFDIGESSANNIMVYNTIKINTGKIPIDATMNKDPIVDKNKLNYCYVDFNGVDYGR